MPIDPIADISKANDRYRASLRTTWIASPADTSLLVDAVPDNVPTIVTLGWNTDLETVFLVTGKSGTNSSNYALTGVTRLKGANVNLPENTPVNCLNNEEFFNQYEEKINLVIDAINTSLGTVEDLDAIVQGDWVSVADAATMDMDLALGVNRKFKMATTSANRIITFSNPKIGQPFIIRMPQTTTARTHTWPSTITWQGIGDDPDTAVEIPASKVGTWGFVCTNVTGTPAYDGFFLGAEE